MQNLLSVLIIISFAVIILSLLFYVVLIIRYNDFAPKNLKLDQFNNLKVLFIYPHPDDETMASGAFMSYLTKNNRVKVVTVTPGQHGDELVKVPPEQLAEIRRKEFINAVTNLGVTDYEIWDFIDGKTKYAMSEIKSRVKALIESFKPDLVVTYEKYGVYGHPDHMVLSKIVHELEKEMKFKTLYSTIAQKIFKRINLPTFMAESQISPTLPQYKFNTLKFARTKYIAAKSHKSQNLSRGRPLSLQMAIRMNEYFTENWEEEN